MFSLSDCGLLCLQGILNSPAFEQKVTGKVWPVNGRSTSPWLKAIPKPVIQGKVQSYVGYHASNSEGSAQPIRYGT